jgi:hypothetical protein
MVGIICFFGVIFRLAGQRLVGGGVIYSVSETWEYSIFEKSRGYFFAVRHIINAQASWVEGVGRGGKVVFSWWSIGTLFWLVYYKHRKMSDFFEKQDQKKVFKRVNVYYFLTR